jgi:threonine aldolase
MQRFEIDLFSDNAAQPTDSMRRFMAAAPVGDEEHGEDPTVRELEQLVARLTGKDDAVFAPSGTMCNIVAYAVHCGPGDEILVHEDSHPVYSGYGGPAVPGRPPLRRLRGESGVITDDTIHRALADAQESRRARLLSLENTHNRSGGSIWPLEAIDTACAAARAYRLITHLDGARLLNATAATGIQVARYCAPFDSAWIDLSKGLGCPSGAVLAGDLDFIARARRAKYLHGGVMHKAGILAAAGIYALEHHVDRLRKDNERASRLADALAVLPGIDLLHDRVETNLVYFSTEGAGIDAAALLAFLAPAGIRLKATSEFTLRAAIHLDVRDDHIDRVHEAIATALEKPQRASR